jgi:hypothetical protein
MILPGGFGNMETSPNWVKIYGRDEKADAENSGQN